MWIILKLIPTKYWILAGVIAGIAGLYAIAYTRGVAAERLSWQTKTTELQAQIKKQEEESNERTRQLIQAYELRIKNARSTNGSTRPELTTVRVHNSCTSGEDAPVQTGPAPSIPEPVVTQTEWERINYARFEEQRIQLEALIDWVHTLYRTWSPR